MVRLRTIAEQTDEHERRLGAAREELLASGLDDDAFAAAWTAAVGWSFDEVNALIDAHNRFYPAESRLPMDPRTRDYALVGGEDYRRRPLDAAWALEQFPAQRLAPDRFSSGCRRARSHAHADRHERDRAEERAEEVRRGIAEQVREPRRRPSARPARRPPRRCS